MKKLVCIVCPNSCELEITETESGISVSGNKCKRGVSFATDEMTAPKRTISSVVKTAFFRSGFRRKFRRKKSLT